MERLIYVKTLKRSSQSNVKSYFAMHRMMILYFPNQLLYRSLKGYHISQQEFPHDRDDQKLQYNFMIMY